MKYYTNEDIDNMVPSYYTEKFVSAMMGRQCPVVNGDYCHYKHDVDEFLLANKLKTRKGKTLKNYEKETRV